MAQKGFLPVSRVTSPFNARTAAGSRANHSFDLHLGEGCSGYLRVLADCGVDISKGLDGVPLLRSSLIQSSPFLKPFCLATSRCSIALTRRLRFSSRSQLLNMEMSQLLPENARAFTRAPPTSIAMLTITSGYRKERAPVLLACPWTPWRKGRNYDHTHISRREV